MVKAGLYGIGLIGALALFMTIAGRAVVAGESRPPIEYRTLKLDDFPIRAHVPANLDAYTHVRMSYRAQQKTVQDTNMWRSEVVLMEIQCTVLPDKSWRRATLKDPNATLTHEQGHFDLCEGKARQLRMQTLGSYPAGRGSDRTAAEADLSHVLNIYFAKRYEELNREHRKYDKETKFGRTAVKQKPWTERLEKGTHE